MSSESNDPAGPGAEPPVPPATPAGDVPPAPATDDPPPGAPGGGMPDQPAADPPPSGPIPPAAPPLSFDPGPASSSYEDTRPGAGGTGMDMSAVPRSVWISLGGGVVLLVSVFFSWYTLTVHIANRSGSKSESGWDSGTAGKLIALLAIVIIGAWLVELFADNVTLPFPAWAIAGAAGAAALLLVLFKIVSKPASSEVGQFNALGFGHASVGTAWGIWVALISVVAVLIGAYLRMNDESPRATRLAA